MTSHWIGVAAGNHVAAGVEGGFAMFGHGRQEAVRKVRPGDWVTYYCPREGMNAGAELRAFTALGQALPGEAAMREMLPGVAGWYLDMRWLDGAPADVYPLLEKFSFVTDRRHWGMYFRKSLFGIDVKDFELVADAMGVGDEFRNHTKP